MMKDAEAHATEAHAMRELADAKNMAENLVYQTEKALKENRDALEESVAATIEGRIMELNEALKGSDLADVKAKTDALVEASHQLAEAVYAKAQADGAAASAAGGDGAGDEEVVEDADYEVVDEEAKS
jgi:molecular chaperone DnaK